VLGLPLQQLKRQPWLVDYQRGEAAIRALSKTLELPELSNFGSPPAEPGVYLREIRPLAVDKQQRGAKAPLCCLISCQAFNSRQALLRYRNKQYM